MEDEEGIADNFDFDSWVIALKLTEKTVTTICDEDLNSFDCLSELTLEDIKDLGLTIGQRKALIKGVDSLRASFVPGSNTSEIASSITEDSLSTCSEVISALEGDSSVCLKKKQRCPNKPNDLDDGLPKAMERDSRDNLNREKQCTNTPAELDVGLPKENEELRCLIEKHGLDETFWQDIFKEKLKIQKVTQLGFIGLKSMDELISYIRFDWEERSLKAMFTEAGATLSETPSPKASLNPQSGNEVNQVDPKCEELDDLTRVLKIHGLESEYWMTVFKEKLKITSSKSLNHLTDSDFILLSNEKRYEGEISALMRLLNEAGACVNEDQVPGRIDNTSKIKSDVEQLLKEISLTKYYPRKISQQHVFSCLTELDKHHLTFQPLVYLNKFIMLDYNARDRLEPELKQSQWTESNEIGDIHNLFALPGIEAPTLHPQDIFLLVYHCCDLHLRQMLMQKLFICRLAIPFIYPTFVGDNIESSIWSLRSIVVDFKNSEQKSVEHSIVQTPVNIIAFARAQSTQVTSKSIILNDLLSESSHPTFYHRDCPLGMANRRVSQGVVEASWYLPSGKQSDSFKKCLMLLNVRGDCLQHQKLMQVVGKIASITVLFVNVEELCDQAMVACIERCLLATEVILVINRHGLLPQETLKKTLLEFSTKLGPANMSHTFIIYTFALDRPKNATLIKNEICRALGKGLTSLENKTLENCIRILKEEKCGIDEDEPDCIKGKEIADRIMAHINIDPVDLKMKMLPLQGDHWLKWSQLQKQIKRSVGKGKTPAEIETNDLRNKMEQLRRKQLETCASSTPLVKSFREELSKLFTEELEKVVPFFLSWLKMHLDNRSRDTLPDLHKAYQDKWKAFQISKRGKDSDIKVNRKEMELAEKQLANASFGLEHLFREMGQMYEAVIEHRPKIEDDRMNWVSKLPKIVAKLLIGGHPFELMDGDAANIPITWVEAIFNSLDEILGHSKVFCISVLGIQSSGKSTLLNTMFGLQFAVSAGRCTRGVYMQLVRVDKTQSALQFDFALVVDTEGLRAPELGLQKYDHDNELATLVIGLGDVNIINIKGENYAEMKDVIQVAVHAFLRMKLVRRSESNRSRCIFIHQNVPAVNAEDKMRHGCQKLQESLDEMAVEAASQENLRNIRSFADIIVFDCLTDVRYFPDLWHGVPPMAHANTGYTENVKLLKNHILFQLPKEQNSFLSLQDSLQHIKDLWNGILADDFVFSFRNVIEQKAYSQLDKKILKLNWTLEETINAWLNTKAASRLGSCGTEDECKRSESDLNDEAYAIIDKKALENESDLVKYFIDSSHADTIIQWKENKILTLRNFTTELHQKVQTNLRQLRTEREMKLLESDQTYKDEIMKEALVLATDLKGRKVEEKVLRDAFDSMWAVWQKNLSSKEYDVMTPEKIAKQLEDIIKDMFPAHYRLVRNQLAKTPIQLGASSKRVYNTITTDFLKDENYVTVHTNKGMWERSGPIKERAYQNAFNRINDIMRKIDLFLDDLQKKDTKFTNADAKKIVKIVTALPDCLDDENKKYDLSIHHNLKVKLVVYVSQFAYPIFCQLQQKYEERHGFHSMIKKYKETTWKMFEHTVAERNEEDIVADLVSDLLKDAVYRAVEKALPSKMVDYIMGQLQSKMRLIFMILDSLATNANFEDCYFYSRSPKTYAIKWVKKFIERHYFKNNDGSNETRYANIACWKVHQLVEKLTTNISDAMDSSVNNQSKEDASVDTTKWIEEFCKLAKNEISINALDMKHLSDRKISDRRNFLAILKRNLHTRKNEVEQLFREDKSEGMNDEPMLNLLVNKLWGCEEVCPFCKEPCQYSNPNHLKDGMSHLCVQHRPGGVTGRHWHHNNKLTIATCNYSVKNNHSYSCNENNCPTSKQCGDKSQNETVFHPYTELKLRVPDWDIPPADDMESCKYWLWYMKTHNNKIAERLSVVQADIPNSWESITVEEAKDSLRAIYKG